MNEKKINGLYLSYRDFINDYISELEAWQNKYPDGTELDYLYTLEEEASRYYYYSKNEGSMFPFKDTIKIKYSLVYPNQFSKKSKLVRTGEGEYSEIITIFRRKTKFFIN